MQINKVSFIKYTNSQARHAKLDDAKIKKYKKHAFTHAKQSFMKNPENCCFIAESSNCSGNEAKAKKIARESIVVLDEIKMAKTIAEEILRCLKTNEGGWGHEKALKTSQNNGHSNALIDGMYYTISNPDEATGNTDVTKIADGSKVVFDKKGRILTIDKDDMRICTDIYYYGEKGEETAFLVYEGYKSQDNTESAKGAYYISKNCAFHDLSVGNGKKSFKDYYLFVKTLNYGTHLKEYKDSKGTHLVLQSIGKRYNYTENGTTNMVVIC